MASPRCARRWMSPAVFAAALVAFNGMAFHGSLRQTVAAQDAVDADAEIEPVAEFRVARESHPSMEIHKPLLTAEEAKELKPLVGKYRTALRKGETGEAARKLIRDALRYRIYSMTLKTGKEEIRELPEIREDLAIRELQSAAILLNDAEDVRDFRRFVMGEVVKLASDLLDNNFYVRIQAAILLAELNLTEENSKLKLPLEAFAPAAIPLQKIVADPDQPEAVKIAAVYGLTRILALGNVGTPQRTEIAGLLVAELKRNDTYYWYQRRLCMALAVCGVSQNLQRQPFVVDTLVRVMADPRRHWMCRSEAAAALGRVPLDGGVDVDLLIYQVVLLSRDMVKAFIAEPDNRYWKPCYWNLYTAFQPQTKGEQRRKAGLLRLTQPVVRNAYQVVLPVCSKIINGQKLAVQDSTAIETWLTQNKPQGNRIAPGLGPIEPSEPNNAAPVSLNP